MDFFLYTNWYDVNQQLTKDAEYEMQKIGHVSL